ncbi:MULTISPECIES: hypothetical protein [unclassified Bradyrhizobium]|uniref:hypothetical protein n=1 Tax=unclassified Bradyrhizobium TaxID=2631580 RepID=UPI002916E711|nr:MULTISPECIES: hypothetical protein [unclassified Bradyrhizobium]
MNREKPSNGCNKVLLSAKIVAEAFGDVTARDLGDGGAAAFQHRKAHLLQVIVAGVNAEPAGIYQTLAGSCRQSPHARSGVADTFLTSGERYENARLGDLLR